MRDYGANKSQMKDYNISPLEVKVDAIIYEDDASREN
jgi:hypothetical protein